MYSSYAYPAAARRRPALLDDPRVPVTGAVVGDATDGVVLPPGVVERTALAEAAAAEGDWASALEHAHAAVALAPASAACLANRSLLLAAGGSRAGFEAALADARAAARLAPDWPRARVRLAAAARSLRLFSTAAREAAAAHALARAALDARGGGGGDDAAELLSAAQAAVAEAAAAVEETAKMADAEGGPVDHPPAGLADDEAAEGDVFDGLTHWLLGGGSARGGGGGVNGGGGGGGGKAGGVPEGAPARGGPPLNDASRGGGGGRPTAAAAWGVDGGASSPSSAAGSAPSPAAPVAPPPSSFPLLYLRRYAEGSRGVHARVDVPAETELLAVPTEYLITVEMARATPTGRRVAAAPGVERSLSAAKHCHLALFVLADRREPASFFAPYYAVLPAAYPNMPVCWPPAELAALEGSYMLTQVADRKANLAADYAALVRAAPEVAAFSLDEFVWARLVVASRNFGIVVDGVRTDALVPYADMLNHYRPRQTRWAYDNRKRAFVITSLEPLAAGQQVFDSYGKKCNSRFLLNYGFAVERNVDDDVGQCHDEVRLVLPLRPAALDAAHARRLAHAPGLLLTRFDAGAAGDEGGAAGAGGAAAGSGDGDGGGPGKGAGDAAAAGEGGGKGGRAAAPAPAVEAALSRLSLSAVAALSSAAAAAGAAGAAAAAAAAAPPPAPPGNVPGREFDGAAVPPGAVVGRAVRVSTFYDAESTTEAFSWLRFVHASAEELTTLPRIEEDAELLRRPLRPLSCENEAAVLRQLAAACAAQLAAYPTSLAEDLATLAAGVHAPGSNRRNALVLLRGEKLVCEHYVGLARAALPYLDAPARGAGPAAAADARTALARAHAGTSDADKYMRNVVLPLLRRREDGLTAGGPVGPGGVAPPPVPVRARFHAAGAGAGGGDGAGAAVA